MIARELVRRIQASGCTLVRQKGSHARYKCPGGCATTVPMHAGDIKPGTLASIEKALEPCLGKNWTKSSK
ncbi:MAG TPA: type II toxin-antitoxin system HicA family toxin [Polyangiaceae bacterium]